ncbi:MULTISPECIES: hypothetical protein [Streptomyces]|uniref:hypothetical protein n=1 Tax=Streptomyces lycopersici TaxID=2974589 RepID=UPI0021D0F7EC|nr:hypothetical protein [Streptomyces sp. NEAU-383]
MTCRRDGHATVATGPVGEVFAGQLADGLSFTSNSIALDVNALAPGPLRTATNEVGPETAVEGVTPIPPINSNLISDNRAAMFAFLAPGYAAFVRAQIVAAEDGSVLS